MRSFRLNFVILYGLYHAKTFTYSATKEHKKDALNSDVSSPRMAILEMIVLSTQTRKGRGQHHRQQPQHFHGRKRPHRVSCAADPRLGIGPRCLVRLS